MVKNNQVIECEDCQVNFTYKKDKTPTIAVRSENDENGKRVYWQMYFCSKDCKEGYRSYF